MLASITEQKRALRETMIAKRAALSAAARKDAAARIAENGLPVAVTPGAIVSGWVAMDAELNPYPLMKKLHRAGARLALPAIAAKRLVFKAWAPGDELAAAGFGTSEPRADAPEVDPAIVLVPMLAFDLRGYRIGYGKAYYDGGLTRLRARQRIIAIGLAFDAQCVGQVPAEEHDQRLDYVITETGIRFAAEAR